MKIKIYIKSNDFFREIKIMFSKLIKLQIESINFRFNFFNNIS